MGTIAVGERNKALNALAGRSAYTASAAVYAKLHTGDPGAAGTSNPAVETIRQQVTFGSDASGGVITSTADTQWTNLAANEVLTHVSLWSASSGGTWLGNDDLPAAKSVNAGDSFKIAAGALSMTYT